MIENLIFVNLNLKSPYTKPFYVRIDKIIEVDMANQHIVTEGENIYNPSPKAMKIITDYIKNHEMSDKNSI